MMADCALKEFVHIKVAVSPACSDCMHKTKMTVKRPGHALSTKLVHALGDSTNYKIIHADNEYDGSGSTLSSELAAAAMA